MVVGFVLTLIAFPVLVLATCFPALGVNALTNMPVLGLVAWVAGIVAFGIWRAVVTKNPGVRWGVIAIVAAIAVAAVLWFFPDTLGIHVLR